jgi:hypothetical protein
MFQISNYKTNHPPEIRFRWMEFGLNKLIVNETQFLIAISLVPEESF